MIDPDIEELLIEKSWLVPTIIRLNGPLEAICHIHERNVRSTSLMQKCLQTESLSVVEKLMFNYLNQYTKEYLRTLTEFITTALVTPRLRKIARILRRSRHYLPSKLIAMASLFSPQHTPTFEKTFITWLRGKLQDAFPNQRALLFLAFDYTDSNSLQYQHYISPLVRRCMGIRGGSVLQSTLERSDSFTSFRHMSCVSSKLSSDSESPSEQSPSLSKTPSPVFAELPTRCNRECCAQHAYHQFVLLSWIRENRGRFNSLANPIVTEEIEQLLSKTYSRGYYQTQSSSFLRIPSAKLPPKLIPNNASFVDLLTS